MDIIALAKSASNLSNTGAPNPAGTFRAMHVTTPPMELPDLRISSIRSNICSATIGSGQRTILASTSSIVKVSTLTLVASISCTFDTYASTSMLLYICNILRAMAPAATRPMVSRALERPPPATARTPYLAS